MSDDREKRLDWGRHALDAYVSTLIHIASEDRRSAYLVEDRVDRALALIRAHPGLGTPGPRRNERTFAIPKLSIAGPSPNSMFRRGIGWSIALAEDCRGAAR